MVMMMVMVVMTVLMVIGMIFDFESREFKP